MGGPGRREEPAAGSSRPPSSRRPPAARQGKEPTLCSPWAFRRPWRTPESPQLPLHKRGTRSTPNEHTSSTTAAEGGGSGGRGRGRAHVVRSFPPPCVREHEPPGNPIGCRLAGARNAYITTSIPPPRAAAAWARRSPGRREEARTRAPVPSRGRAWLWAGLYCPPSVVEHNQNGFQLVLGEDEEARGLRPK